MSSLCKSMSCYNTGPEIKILGMKNGHAWDLQFCCGFFWLQSLYFQLCTCSSSRPEVLCKKSVLRNFTKFSGKHLCQRLFFRDSLAQVFSCEFCGISKNNFFYRTLPVAVSAFSSSTRSNTSFDLIFFQRNAAELQLCTKPQYWNR